MAPEVGSVTKIQVKRLKPYPKYSPVHWRGKDGVGQWSVIIAVYVPGSGDSSFGRYEENGPAAGRGGRRVEGHRAVNKIDQTCAPNGSARGK